MFCNKCGAQLPDGTQFCNICGAPQVQPTQNGYEQPVQPVQPVYEQPVQPTYEQPGYNPQVPPQYPTPAMPPQNNGGKNKNVIVIAIIAVIAVIAIVVGILFGTGVIGGKDKDKDDDDDKTSKSDEKKDDEDKEDTTEPDTMPPTTESTTEPPTEAEITTLSCTLISTFADSTVADLYPSSFSIDEDGSAVFDGDIISYTDDDIDTFTFYDSSDGTEISYKYTIDETDLTITLKLDSAVMDGESYNIDDLESAYGAEIESATYSVTAY